MDDIKCFTGDYVLIEALDIYNDDGDDFADHISGTVVDINYDKMEIEVAFGLRLTEDDTFIEIHGGAYDENGEHSRWYSIDRVYQVEREYKVMEITDNIDTNTNEPLVIVKLSPIKKDYQKIEGGYRIYSTFSLSNCDTFILTENSSAYKKVCYRPEINKIINFENFHLGYSYADGIEQPTFYDKPNDSYYSIGRNYNDNDK